MKTFLKNVRRFRPVNAILTRAGAAIADVAPPLRGPLSRRLPRSGISEAVLPNGARLRLWSRADDGVSNGVYWHGWVGVEGDTLPCFYERAREARVVLDVGAHVGHFALVAAHANADARVLAFEPLSRAFARLVRNVAENRVRNVECIKLALADENGSAEIFARQSSGVPSGSSLRQEVCGHTATETIRTARLDDLREVLGIDRVDLIKVDVEGFEPNVLRGASATLEAHRPDIVCEVLTQSSTTAELEALLAPLGYRYYHLGAHGPRRMESIVAHPPPHRNYLFTTRD